MSASHEIEMRVESEHEGIRLDAWLALHFPGWSRRRITRALEEGAVIVDGRRAVKGAAVRAGMRVGLLRPPDTPEQLRPIAEEGPLEILLEDAALVAVLKPAGMATHPLRAGELGTVANRIVARFPECALASPDPREAGLVHRLDHGTSGVLLAARQAPAYGALREAFRTEQVTKHYLALASGIVESQVVSAPLRVEPGRRRVVTTTVGSRTQTAIEAVERLRDLTLVRCKTTTGRRHQVRAHLASIGHPILGDDLYGGPPGPPVLLGFFLHAERIEVPHPLDGHKLETWAPLPPDRAQTLEQSR